MLCSIRMQPLWGSESSSQSCRNRKHKIPVGQPCFHDFGSQIHVFLLGKQNPMEVSDLIDILCYFWTGTSALPSESHSAALWVLLESCCFWNLWIMKWPVDPKVMDPLLYFIQYVSFLVWFYVAWNPCRSGNLAEGKKQANDFTLLKRHSIEP